MKKLSEIQINYGETVRELVGRIFLECGKLVNTPEDLRRFNCFPEVTTGAVTEEMEAWLMENVQEGAYFFVEHGGSFIPHSYSITPSKNVWFFDDDKIAAMFKLAYGI